jgi:hypothetical protein
MCLPFGKQFDGVFNLFTSFGYFDNDEDNLNTIKAIKADLNAHGFGVIDFMNSDFVKETLVPEEVKVIESISFFLRRYVQDGYILKDIKFSFEGVNYNFQERVRAFSLEDFENLFEQANVTLLDVFGDYKLSKFNKQTSERLVMIFK